MSVLYRNPALPRHDCGVGYAAWTVLTRIAAVLACCTRLLGFAKHDLLAKAEPSTMRNLVCQLTARLARHARRRFLPFDRNYRHSGAVATA